MIGRTEDGIDLEPPPDSGHFRDRLREVAKAASVPLVWRSCAVGATVRSDVCCQSS